MHRCCSTISGLARKPISSSAAAISAVNSHCLTDRQDMVQFDGRLFNVPQPGLFEAGSSWMSRLALAQGASLSEVLKLFRLIGHVDLDRRLRGNRLAQIRRVCGLPNSALAIHERVMTSLESMHPVGEHYLAQTESNRPRFRYCPQCLSEMRSPHLYLST